MISTQHNLFVGKKWSKTININKKGMQESSRWKILKNDEKLEELGRKSGRRKIKKEKRQ